MNQDLLYCDIQTHNRKPITFVCLKKDCQISSPCCNTCLIKSHVNHSSSDFKELDECLAFGNQLKQTYLKLKELYKKLETDCLKQLKIIGDLIEKQELYKQIPNLQQLDFLAKTMKTTNFKQKTDQINIFTSQISKLNETFSEIIREMDHNWGKFKQKEESLITKPQQVKMNIISIITEDTKVRYQLKVQLQHKKKISALTVSYCGKYLASGDYGGLVKLWGVEKAQISQSQFQFPGEDNPVQCLLFSHDNQILAAAIQYKAILIFTFDSQEFQPVKQLQELECKIDSLAITNDSFYLISGCFDTIKVWNIWQAKVMNTYPFPKGVNQITVSDNQKYLGCYSWKENLAYLFDCSNISNQQKLIEWEIVESPQCIQFIKESTQILISGIQGIFVWKIDELLKSQYVKPLIIFKFNSYQCSVSTDGSLLFCRQFKQLNIIKYNTQETVQIVELKEETENELNKYVVVSLDMKYVVVNEDRAISIFTRNEQMKKQINQSQ